MPKQKPTAFDLPRHKRLLFTFVETERVPIGTIHNDLTITCHYHNTFEMPTPLEEFEAVFPKLVEDLTEHAKQHGIPSDALKWYQNVRSPPPPTP